MASGFISLAPCWPISTLSFSSMKSCVAPAVRAPSRGAQQRSRQLGKRLGGAHLRQPQRAAGLRLRPALGLLAAQPVHPRPSRASFPRTRSVCGLAPLARDLRPFLMTRPCGSPFDQDLFDQARPDQANRVQSTADRWTAPWTGPAAPQPGPGGRTADWTGQIGLDLGWTAPAGQSIGPAAWSIWESNSATDSAALAWTNLRLAGCR